MRTLLHRIFSELSDNLVCLNDQRRESGALPFEKQEIRIVGQMALLLNDLPFLVAATADLDVLGRVNFQISKELSDLLLEEGIRLETDGHLIWMPTDTHFLPFGEWPFLVVTFARHRDVMRSKKRFQREKDANLIETYRKFFPDFEREAVE